MSKTKAKSKPKKGYDQGRILDLWQAGKSILEITEAMKPISRVYVHRVLTTKYPEQYEAGQKARKAEREKAAK
jgi:hypothetical protein